MSRGTLINGYVIQNLSWQRGFWFISIACGLSFIGVFFFVPEVSFISSETRRMMVTLPRQHIIAKRLQTTGPSQPITMTSTAKTASRSCGKRMGTVKVQRPSMRRLSFLSSKSTTAPSPRRVSGRYFSNHFRSPSHLWCVEIC